ncbi:hypothetical protein [Myxococcus sp. RHSTA-1-4]|uniref:hypothetical protein n=1 Tax=Myxococcus sp. RHSTA-1-4 TaxID=2874601 RepID=UPI001CC060A3|nr:hypothetical protein [Myxococcus sp. RHSTA-1-4]MBZ4422011.1 hypothetical protein [Myxococcus sp. RHSTA-1-4]
MRRPSVLELPPRGAHLPRHWRHFTPRQREVFAQPRTVATLLELLRERPRGTCVVCWRDVHASSLAESLACSRLDVPGLKASACSSFVRAIVVSRERSTERAKASLLAELHAAEVHRAAA